MGTSKIAVQIGNGMARGYLKCKNSSIFSERILFRAIQSIYKNDNNEFISEPIKISSVITNYRLDNESKMLVKNIVNELCSTSFYIETENRYVSYPLFSMLDYDVKKGEIKFKFNPMMAPFITAIHQQFTYIFVDNLCSLQGKYAQALYRYIKSLASIGMANIKLETIYEVLGINKNRKPGEVKGVILAPAIKEINKKMEILVDCTTNKVNGKTVGYKFKITKKQECLDYEQTIKENQQRKKFIKKEVKATSNQVILASELEPVKLTHWEDMAYPF